MGMSLDDFDVDLEKGILDCQNVYTKSPEKPLTHMSPDSKPVKTGEETLGSLENHDASPVRCAISKPGWGRSEGKEEKRKKSASKPPRPPRGPSLDAADQKLMREIAELAMLKRARVERMRALKKSREAKAASASAFAASSSLGNVLATLLTAIFFFVLVLQGFSPRADASSPLASGGFVPVQYAGNPSASEPGVGYGGPVIAQRLPNLLKPVSGLENEQKTIRVSQ